MALRNPARTKPSWDVFYESAVASEFPTDELRPCLTSTLGWNVYDARLHANWVIVASTRIDAGQGLLGVDLSAHGTMANATIDLMVLWRYCGVHDRFPALSGTGDIAVRDFRFHLADGAKSGVMQGICGTKPYNQILGSTWSGVAFQCSSRCPAASFEACATCRLGMFLACARRKDSAEHLAVECRVDADGVLMEFRKPPTLRLTDADHRTLNKWSLSTLGIFRDARRANFQSARALASMFSADRNTAFARFVDRVVSSGWHTKVGDMLSRKGVHSWPYEHQSAAVLAMVEMEGRTNAIFGAHAAEIPPAYGREGFTGFLRESMVHLAGDVHVNALTGAVVTTKRLQDTLAGVRGGLLALPPGVGKTYTCMALAVLAWTPGQDSIAAVVRAPPHLTLQWKRELRRFCDTAMVIDAAVVQMPIDAARVRNSAGPVFVIASPESETDAMGVASRGGCCEPPYERDTPGVRTDRTFIDEAHDVQAATRAPSRDEAVWAVTATPFFSNSACRDGLFEVLQKVPRHFGLPVCHGQLLNLFKKDAGSVYTPLTLNLHELDQMLPRVWMRTEMVSVDRNDLAFQTFASRVMQMASQQRASWIAARGGMDTLLRLAHARIRAAAQGGSVLYVDELFPRTGNPGFQFLHSYYFQHALGSWHLPDFQDVVRMDAHEAQAVVSRIDADDDDCAVCLDSLEGDLVVLPCGHTLHYQCLSNWHRSGAQNPEVGAGRCALCRHEYDVRNLRSVVRTPPDLRDGSAGVSSTPVPDSVVNDPHKWSFTEVHATAARLVDAHLQRGEGKAIVFLEQHSAVRLHPYLRERGITFVNCIEAGTAESRASAIARFVNEEPQVLLIDPKSETGLNLTVANFVLNYAGHKGSFDQIQGRVRRLGQRWDVHIVQMQVDTAHLRCDI